MSRQSVSGSTVHGSVIQIAGVKGNVTVIVADTPVSQVRTALDDLARTVWEAADDQWRQRRAHDSRTMPVMWRTVGPPVSDHWRVIRGAGDAVLDLDGGLVRDDRPEGAHGLVATRLCDLVATRVPSGRVVLLGRSGSGKSTLTVRFTLDWLRNREVHLAQAETAPGSQVPIAQRVPVILRLSTWDPRNESLYAWIGTQLAEDYGVTGQVPMAGVLPVFDGLDEMRPELRGVALSEINQNLCRGQSRAAMLFTSRTEEYQAAIADSGVLTAAAVVELADLPLSTATRYLHDAISPSFPERAERWAEVFAWLETRHDGPLARALTTPLAVALARLAYVENDADPRELLQLRHPGDIEARLLDQSVPACYPDPPEEPLSGGRVWRRSEAERHLTFLARHMRRHDTYDLRWWELFRMLPRTARFFLAAVPSALIFVSVGEPLYASVAALVAGAANVLMPSMSRQMFQVKVFWADAPRSHKFTLGLVAGLFASVPVGSGYAFAAYIGESDVLFGGLAGVGCGFLIGMGIVLLTPTSNPDLPDAVSPAQNIRLNKRWAIAYWWPLAMFTGVVASMLLSPLNGVKVGVASGLAVALLLAFRTVAWGEYLVAKFWFALTRELPWDSMSFVDDACRRGVLRQVGASYQFRHTRLCDYLAISKPHSP